MSDKSLNTKTLLEGLINLLKNEIISEKAVSKKQQKFMGMVHAAQKGEKAASPEVAKVAKTMKKKDVTDFAKTKHKGLPTKVKNEECGEVTDEELKMFSRKSVGSRKSAFQGDNPWNHLKKRGRHMKSRVRNEESEMEECAGVGIVDKQNSTKDVGPGTLQKNLDAFNLEEAYLDMCADMMAESKLRNSAKTSVPGMRKHTGLDNSSPYAPWRFGIALAGSPDFEMDKIGPTGQSMVTVAYTEADAEIIKAAEKFMGASGVNVTTAGSNETEKVNKVSPVAKIKRNKYGI